MSTRTDDTTAHTAVEGSRERSATRSVSWTNATDDQADRQQHTVLFRKASATRWVVQHVRTVTLRQRGETTSTLDADASLSDVPTWAIDEAGLEYDGGVLRG